MILSKSLNQAAEKATDDDVNEDGSHDRVVTAFNTEDEHCVYVKNTTSANLSQKSIYNALGIKHDPLKNIYFKQKIQTTARM